MVIDYVQYGNRKKREREEILLQQNESGNKLCVYFDLRLH